MVLIVNTFYTNRVFLTPQIIVTVGEDNVYVDAVCGSDIAFAYSVNGVAVLKIPYYGVWSVRKYLEGNIVMTEDVVVNEAKQYNVELSFKSNFSDNSWEDIIKACEDNAVPDTWLVGSSKKVDLNGSPGLVYIIGKNHDDYSDGSGKAPLTFQLRGGGYSGNYHDNYDIRLFYTNSHAYTRYLPSRKSIFPAVIRTNFKNVLKPTCVDASGKISSLSLDLFPLSEIEVTGTERNSYRGTEEGTQYEYFKLGEVSSGKYWLRSSPNSSGRGYAMYANKLSTDFTWCVGNYYHDAFCF